MKIRIRETSNNNLENIEKYDDKKLYELGYNLLNGHNITRDVEKARIYLEKSAKLENKSANFLMGTIYLDAIGVEQDLDKALEYFKIADAQEEIEKVQAKIKERKMNRMGENSSISLDDNKSNYEENSNLDAVDETKLNTTITSDSDELYEMGSNLLGNGNSEDLEKAKMYLEKASTLGNKLANFVLGSMYANAIGVEQNLKRAVEYYKLANAEQQVKEFSGLLNEFGDDYKYINNIETSNKTSIQIPEIIIEKSKAQSTQENLNNHQTMLSDPNELYEMGSNLLGNGNPEDLEKARYYLERAATLGNKSANFTLGSIYMNAIGVEQDLQIALNKFKKAGANDLVSNLNGMINNFGNDYKYISEIDKSNSIQISVPQYVIENEQNKSKQEALEKPQTTIFDSNELYKKGSKLLGNGNSEDLEKAKVYLEQASELGNKSASFTLGSIYTNAIGVKQDLNKALEYYKKANADDQINLINSFISNGIDIPILENDSGKHK